MEMIKDAMTKLEHRTRN